MTVIARILSADELNRDFPKRGQMDLSEYENMLTEVNLTPTKAAEIPLGDLTPRAIKRRVGQSARKLGLAVKWKRSADDEHVKFRITLPSVRKDSDGRIKSNRN